LTGFKIAICSTRGVLETDLIEATRENSRRLMVVLHGLGDSIEGYRWLPTELGVSDLNYLLVNAPDDYYGGFSWYDIYGEADPGVRRSRRLLSDLLEAQREQGFPSEETIMFGFSQGGLMCLEIGARYPHRLAGVISISGYVHELERLVSELSPVATQQRFLMTHGQFDPLIPIEPVRTQYVKLRAAGLDVQWHEFAKVHTIEGQKELAVIREFVQQRPGERLRSHPKAP
jgi:phospholipase/carboxylesterase